MALKRRRFLLQGAVGAGVGIVPSRARAAQFSYKLGHDVPASHPIGVAAIEFANAVKRETGGRLEIKVFPENTLGSDASMIAQLRSGALEFAIEGGGTLSAVAPLAGISYVGFTFADAKVARAATDGALGLVVRESLEQIGFRVFEKSWDNGFRQVANDKHPVRTVDDMNGLKLRVVQSATSLEMFRALGASPVPLDIAEVYTSIQTRLLDGADGTFANFTSMKLYEVVKYLSVTNHQFSALWLCMAGQAWKALPPDIQSVLHRNANLYASREERDVELQEKATADRLARLGMRIEYPDLKPFRARLTSYYQRWKAEYGAAAWGALEQYSGKLA